MPPMADAAPIRLFAYKQTHDTGFAPNPFHGVCTLATCKPKIRLHKQVGDWVAGFTSKELNKGRGKVGEEKLIYLMRVTDKIPLELYFAADRFAAKRASDPADLTAPCISSVGDNIYEQRDGVWIQHPNRSHKPHDIPKDTGGRFALISNEFYYFGSVPLEIPDEIRPRVPAFQAAGGVQTKDVARARAFVDFVVARGPGIHARPHTWKSDDESWRQP